MEREREQEIARLVDKRFEILNELYPDSEFNISKLAVKTSLDHGNISRYIDELKREKLVTTREEKRGRGKPYRYCRLTDKCKRILDAVVDTARPEPKELEKPDFEWVEFLIGMICPPARCSTAPMKSGTLEGGTPERPPSEDALKEALNDFHQVCQTTRIWEYEAPKKQGERDKTPKKQGERDNIWSFFKRALKSGARLPKTMSDLRIIVNNASREKRKNIINHIRKTFATEIEGIATTPDADMEARHEAVRILDTILGANKKWGTFTRILDEVMKGEKDENIYTYERFIQCLFSPFRELYRKHRIDLQRWFYNKMSDENPTVRSRARLFYSAIR
jgi:predicted transcriptional regulator